YRAALRRRAEGRRRRVNVAVATAAKSIVSQRVILAREGRNSWLVARMRSGWLVMSDTQVVPGQLILLSDPVVGSLNDLDAGQRALFLADMALAGDALLAVTGCLRVNYDILGNSDPALHAHIVPRYASEPEERRRSVSRSRRTGPCGGIWPTP